MFTKSSAITLEVNKILDRVGNMSLTEASDDDKKTEV